jgi:hypothetical protein
LRALYRKLRYGRFRVFAPIQPYSHMSLLLAAATQLAEYILCTSFEMA